MQNVSVSRYRNIRSLIHKIDPLTKFIGFIAITTLIFMSFTLPSLTLVFSFVIVVGLLARVKIKSFFTSILFVLPFFIMMTFFYWLASLNTEQTIYDVLKIIGFLSARLYLFFIVAIIYTSTTKEIEIASSIEWFITPLRIIKVPTYEISMIITLAIRFVPLMIEDLIMISIAQTSRGYNVYNGSLKTKIKGFINSLLPMLILAFKRSDDISNAMIIRGYEVGKKRSKFLKNKFFILEWLTIIVLIILFVAVITWGNNATF